MIDDGTATPGSDFPSAIVPVDFADGEREVQVAVQFPDDSSPECIETLSVELRSFRGGARPGSNTLRTIHILDNDQVGSPNEYHFSLGATATISAEYPGLVGIAGPEPLTLSVFGVEGEIATIGAKLVGLSHDSISDLDIVLESPSGTYVKLMSDTFSGNIVQIGGVNLEFADGGTFQPNSPPLLQANVLAPWDHQPNADQLLDGTEVPAGAVNLSAFAGEDPNGIWRLHIVDDNPRAVSPFPEGYGGSLSGGWELLITSSPEFDFRILSIENDVSSWRIRFPKRSGKVYQLQTSPDLDTWSNLATPITGADAVHTANIPPASLPEEPSYFFRVLELDP